MPLPFSFDPALLVIMLLFPLGIIVVTWIALRRYFETREVGFLSIALAFMLIEPASLLIGTLLRFVDFMVSIYFFAGMFVLFFALIAYGLLKLSSKPQGGAQKPSGGKLNLKRQLSLLAGVTMILAVFYPWIAYIYTYDTPTASGSMGGSFFLFDVFLLPSTLELEQIDISALVIGATLAGILLLVAGLGCIVEDAEWSVLSVPGLTAFFFTYVGSPGANLLVATGGKSGPTGWYMALSSGFILGILGAAIGLAALIFSFVRPHFSSARTLMCAHGSEI